MMGSPLPLCAVHQCRRATRWLFKAVMAASMRGPCKAASRNARKLDSLRSAWATPGGRGLRRRCAPIPMSGRVIRGVALSSRMRELIDAATSETVDHGRRAVADQREARRTHGARSRGSSCSSRAATTDSRFAAATATATDTTPPATTTAGRDEKIAELLRTREKWIMISKSGLVVLGMGERHTRRLGISCVAAVSAPFY
jgi:hypothetical protein